MSSVAVAQAAGQGPPAHTAGWALSSRGSQLRQGGAPCIPPASPCCPPRLRRALRFCACRRDKVNPGRRGCARVCVCMHVSHRGWGQSVRCLHDGARGERLRPAGPSLRAARVRVQACPEDPGNRPSPLLKHRTWAPCVPPVWATRGRQRAVPCSRPGVACGCKTPSLHSPRVCPPAWRYSCFLGPLVPHATTHSRSGDRLVVGAREVSPPARPRWAWGLWSHLWWVGVPRWPGVLCAVGEVLCMSRLEVPRIQMCLSFLPPHSAAFHKKDPPRTHSSSP